MSSVKLRSKDVVDGEGSYDGVSFTIKDGVATIPDKRVARRMLVQQPVSWAAMDDERAERKADRLAERVVKAEERVEAARAKSEGEG